MQIKKIKHLKVNSYDFEVKWNKEHSGGLFSYQDKVIEIGLKNQTPAKTFMIICHELQEICAIEMNCRFQRPDCDSDYIFVYDHRQHETMSNMFSSLISQFIQ